MTIVAKEDNRNKEWRANNVGSKLLQKMGWKEGEGVGKRNKSNTTSLRALKRQEGLGLGAKKDSEGGNSESANHFASVLANLQAHHNPTTTTTTTTTKDKPPKKKKSKTKKQKLTLPQNKVTAGHARKMRQAKFGKKSAEDMACIFGNKEVARQLQAEINQVVVEPTMSRKKKKSKRAIEDVSEEGANEEEKREKRKLRKEKKKKLRKEKKGKTQNTC